jgi:hypothetical protein
MRRRIFNNFESLEELVYWMYNKIKNGSTGGGSGGITQTQLDNALNNKVDKVSGKTLSSNDYTNDDKSKVGEISNKLDKGTYTGTAKDLADSIEQIKTNSRSVSWADISNKPRVSVTLAENSTSRTYTIGLTGDNGSSGRLIIPKAVSWNDVTDKPKISEYNTITDAHKFLDKDGAIHFGSNGGIANAPSNHFYEMVGFTHSNKNWGFIIAKNIDEDDKTLYIKQVINGSYKEWFKITEQQFEHGGFLISQLNDDKFRKTGVYHVTTPGIGSGLLVSFRAGGSTSTLELYKSHWSAGTRLSVRNTIDGSRFNDDNGGFRDLAWYDDVIRVGVERYDWTVTKEYQNSVVFIPRSGFIELNQLEHLSSISFRKTFDGGNVTFTCNGKQIIYTSGNLFNGGDGSTATVSIWNNKCYIDIRNI